MKQKFFLSMILASLAFAVVACGGEMSLSEVDEGATGDSGETPERGVYELEGGTLDDPLMLSSEDVVVPEATGDQPASGSTVRLITHDSFAASEGVIESFEDQTGIDVELITGEDTGSVLAQLILTKENPIADVVFGIDNTHLQQALAEELFVPYRSTLISTVPAELQLDPENRVTPIDYGDVCVNYWKDALDGPPPESLEDLTAHAGDFVTQNPETSSPGLAFLFATIARFGEEGWEDYWQRLADGGVEVTAGWSEAYFGDFIAGGGNKALVTSYATSPVAEVVFAEEPPESPPTGVLTDGCFRQVEFAGILAGTTVEAAAQALVDFLLSEAFQEDIPLNMFVFPANGNAIPPEEFLRHAAVVADPLSLPPELIAEKKSEWTARWVEIVLR